MTTQVPTFTTRLWSEEVGAAQADALPPQDTVYEFSSGRRFTVPANVFSLPWPEPQE